MPKIYLITITLLLISFNTYCQTDEEQNLLLEQDMLADMQQQAVKDHTFNERTKKNPKTAKSLFVDMDDDGMDDEWEVSNGLDPANPKDAWWDLDEDNVLNLFEFQLETEPNNSASPEIIEFHPEDGEATLEDIINSAENSIKVIRLSEGYYEATVLGVYHENFRIMIQGGWNDDFSEYNPSEYKTDWHGIDDEALNLIIPIDNDVITKSTVILDGINFSSDEYFSLGGPARVSLNSGDGSISIFNCTMVGNPYYGLGLGHKNQANLVDVFIVNTLIGNNGNGGVYTQVTDDATGHWRIINTTINNPECIQGGVSGLTAQSGYLEMKLTNSINWGNSGYSFNFYSGNDVSLSSENSNYDSVSPGFDITEELNAFNTDPMFENAAENDWRLSEQSPCIDEGMDVGLAFSGQAPDIGALENNVVSGVESLVMADVEYFPNPFSENLHIELGTRYRDLKLVLCNGTGQAVGWWSFEETSLIDLDVPDLVPGIYFLNLYAEKGVASLKLVKK